MATMQMQMACAKLTTLLEADELTRGMYVRVRGDNLNVGRREALGPDGQRVEDDRVRLTRLSSKTYGLSVKRHTGRWERTPFSGTMEAMVEVILGLMQHLVAPYP